MLLLRPVSLETRERPDRMLRSQGRRLDWNPEMSGEQVILEVPVQSDQSGAIDDETQESSEVPSLIGVADSIEDSAGADVTTLDSDVAEEPPSSESSRRSVRDRQQPAPLTYFKLGGDPLPVGEVEATGQRGCTTNKSLAGWIRKRLGRAKQAK